MKTKQSVNYILIAVGILIAMYAKVDEGQHTVVLILGICVLMFGIFRLSQSIPSKNEKDNDFNTDNDDSI